MKPVSPVIPGQQFEEIIIAKDQPEYLPLPVIPFSNGMILSRWEMDETEKLVIKATGVFYICLLTFGREIPRVEFQIDCPVAVDAGEDLAESLKPKTLYAGADLPVFSRESDRVWLSLKLTEADREKAAEKGNLYFFMEARDRPVTPSMVQVDTPTGQDVGWIVGIRATGKNRRTAAAHNLEIFEAECCVCGHAIILSTMWNEAVGSGKSKAICTICSDGSSLERCVLPETISQLKTALETRKNKE